MSASRTQLAHMVFFTLKDSSPAAIEKMVAACHQYLNHHPGTVYFSAGQLADLSRPVNDLGFHVALHVVFASKQHHDDYQAAERHLRFIHENKPNWAQVRVFDSYVS